MIRLVSLVENEVNLYSDSVTYLYNEMLEKYNILFYHHFQIIHAGENEQELIYFSQKDVDIKVIYDIGTDFTQKGDLAKQVIFVEIIHRALLKLATEDKRIDSTILETIKGEVLATNFDFERVYKGFPSKKDDLEAKVVIKPGMRYLEVFIDIFQKGNSIQRYLVLRGVPNTGYLSDFFSKGKWKKNEFVLWGTAAELEFHVHLKDLSLEFIATTPSGKTPRFELRKIDADKEKAMEDYLHSLNPAVAAILNGNVN